MKIKASISCSLQEPEKLYIFPFLKDQELGKNGTRTKYGTQDFLGVNSLTNWKYSSGRTSKFELFCWTGNPEHGKNKETLRDNTPLRVWILEKQEKRAGGQTAKMDQDILKDSFDPDRNKEPVNSLCI